MADNKATITITAVDQTAAALKSAQTGLSNLGAEAGKVSSIITGFAALAGATAFAGLIKGSIDAADKLNELSQQSGASVESLSAMKGVAKLAGADMEQVAAGLGKLSKNMLEASQGSGKAADIFKALGISVTDSTGKLKASDAVMLEFSQKLQNVGSGTERVAAAQVVLGKSGAQLLPFLNDLSKFGELQAKVTTAQAQAADNLNDNITRLSLTHKAWVNVVAMEVVPVADSFVQALVEMANGSNGTKKAVADLAADGSIKEWAIGAAKAAGFVVDAFDGIGRVVSLTGMSIAGVTKDIETFVKVSALAAGSGFTEEGQKAIRETIQSRQSFISAMNEDMDKLLMKPQFSDVLSQKIQDLGKSTPEATSGTVALASALKDLGSGSDKAAKALENLHIDQMALITKQAATELGAIAKQQEDYAKALSAAQDPLTKQAQSLEEQVRYYGMTESAIQATIVARIEEARVIAEANGASEDNLAFLDREIELRKRIATASSQKEFLDTNKRAAELSSKEWEKVGDDINRALTDALMRGFDSGKSFGQNFVDSLKSSLKTLVIRVIVNMAASASGNILATAADALLGTRFSSSSGGSSGLSSTLSAANNLSSAYTLYNTSGIVAQWASGSMSTANAAGTIYANTTGTGLDGLLATNGAYGTAASGAGAEAGTGASSASAGIGTVAWVAAIIAGMWMSSEAWKAGIRWENYAKQKDVQLWDAEVSIRAAHDEPARAIFGDGFVDSQFYAIAGGGSLSAQIHYAIQKALFGSKYSTGSQVSGTFSESTQGFDGQYGINMKKTGGLFTKGRQWTEWHALPAEADNVMDTLYRGIRNSFVMLGETFDDTSLAAKMQGFVYSFNIASTDMQTVTNTAAANLTKAIGDILTPSITGLIKSGETWTSAFERILAETQATTRVISLLGDTMSGVFGQNNLDGILKASDNFVQLFGTIENLNTSFSAYFGNYYTGAEQLQQAWKDMRAQFSSINVTMPTSRQGFRDLVDSLNLSTESGRSTFKSLMDLQGAFASLTPTLEDAATAATAMQKASQEMQAAQIGNAYAAVRKVREESLKSQISQAGTVAANATDLIATLTSISQSMLGYGNQLRASDTAGASPLARYGAARSAYESTAALARLGNTDAAGSLQALAETFLQASRDAGTSSSYARDVAGVIATVDTVAAVADRQIPIAQSQLDAANAQVTLLQGILDQLTGTGMPAVVANYQQAATDWASFFGTTAVGQSLQIAAGTMQRLSDSMGLFIDSSGAGYAFSQNDNPYTLASASSAYREYLLQKYGQWSGPSFASGGLHGGGLRLVGENGPEIEFTGPSRILNAVDTSALIETAGGMPMLIASLLREIGELRAEQRAGNAALVSHAAKTARLMDKFDIDGLPETRAA